MRIQLICPASPITAYGNRVTAMRWSKMLRTLGHSIELSQHYGGTICDLLIAMHAHLSADAVIQFQKRHPEKNTVLVLTGTDIYGDLPNSSESLQAMETADRLVTFQPLSAQQLPDGLRSKTRLIYQSADRTPDPVEPDRNSFVISIVGHLREVKDPLRVALAARELPRESRIRVVQAGDADGDDLAAQARKEALRNPRYRYLGSIPRWKVRRLITSSRLLVLSSLIEGGANVISEAVVDYVPVLASRIPGNVGLLGEDYPGYFPPGDSSVLAELMSRAEADPGFYQELKTRCALLARLFLPERELNTWKKLIKEITKTKR